MRRCRCCCQVRVQQQLFLADSKRASESERVRDKQRTAEAIFGSIMFHLVAADSGRITHSLTLTHTTPTQYANGSPACHVHVFYFCNWSRRSLCMLLSQSVSPSLSCAHSLSQPACQSLPKHISTQARNKRREKKNKTNNNNNNGVNDDYES